MPEIMCRYSVETNVERQIWLYKNIYDGFFHHFLYPFTRSNSAISARVSSCRHFLQLQLTHAVEFYRFFLLQLDIINLEFRILSIVVD